MKMFFYKSYLVYIDNNSISIFNKRHYDMRSFPSAFWFFSSEDPEQEAKDEIDRHLYELKRKRNKRK